MSQEIREETKQELQDCPYRFRREGCVIRDKIISLLFWSIYVKIISNFGIEIKYVKLVLRITILVA